MKKVTRKGQAAMEFLMTYGWALLVVLIAIAALAFFGLLNPSKFLPEKCELGVGITCKEFAATTQSNLQNGNNVVVMMSNGLGSTMYDIYLNVSVCTSGLVGAGGHASNPADLPNGTAYVASIAEGDTAKLYLNCTSGMLGLSGSRFKSDVYINYSTLTEGTSTSHAKKGYLSIQVQ